MRTPPLLADFSHARACKPFCENSLTLPRGKLKKDARMIDTIKANVDGFLSSTKEHEYIKLQQKEI